MGRISFSVDIYLEWRDIWVGIYVAPGAVYLCPLPCIVIKLTKKAL